MNIMIAFPAPLKKNKFCLETLHFRCVVMKQNESLKGYFYVISSAIIFGLMPLMAKLIYEEGTSPQSLVLLRNALSVPVLLLLSILTENPVRIKPAALPHISFIALVGCCITPLLLFNSFNYIPSGTATVFHFISPVIVVFGEYLFFKKKLRGKDTLSVIFCVIGIMLFYNRHSEINFKGSFFALASGITCAIYVICLSGFKYKEISGFTFSFYIALVSSAVMLPVCLLTNQLALPQSGFGWLLTILFALSLNVGAVVLFQKGTFLIGGGKASVLSALEPVTSVLAGAAVFGEKITAPTAAGTVLVIIASILIASNNMKSKKDAAV